MSQKLRVLWSKRWGRWWFSPCTGIVVWFDTIADVLDYFHDFKQSQSGVSRTRDFKVFVK